jgi:hypothetical protein
MEGIEDATSATALVFALVESGSSGTDAELDGSAFAESFANTFFLGLGFAFGAGGL